MTSDINFCTLCIVFVLCQGHSCYSCRNGDCLLCPSACLTCESEDYCRDCKHGLYGIACSEQCQSYCKNNSCNKFTGLCEFCEDGYFLNEDRLCDKCPKNCLHCTSASSCTRCVAGYRGILCHLLCINCKPTTPCDQNKGHCDDCKDGLCGLSCDIKCNRKCKSCKRLDKDACFTCSPDRYGENCNNKCSSNCQDATCDGTEGTCTLGCSVGYWGNTCNKMCHASCQDNRCNRLDGHCTLIQTNPGLGVNTALTAVPAVVSLVVVACFVIICLIRSGKCSKAYCVRCQERGKPTDKTVHHDVGAEGGNEDESGYERLTVIAGTPNDCIKNVTVDCEKARAVPPRDIDSLDYKVVDGQWDEMLLREHQYLSPSSTPVVDVTRYSRNENSEALALCHPSIVHEVVAQYEVHFHTKEQNIIKLKVLSPEEQKHKVAAPVQGFGQGLGAYYIDDLDRKRAYIVCKDPETMVEKCEFWEMVWNENCNIIVMLTGTDEELPKNTYCPEVNKKTTYGSVRVKTTGLLNKDDNHCVRRVIELKQKNGERTIYQLQWLFSFSLKLENLVKFREIVTMEEFGVLGPLLIHSRDGASKCGPYMALDMYRRKRESGTTVRMFGCIDHLQKQNSDLLIDDNERRVLNKAII